DLIARSISLGPGSYPVAAAYDSTNGYLYVTSSGLGQVVVIDGATDRVVTTIPVGGGYLDVITYDAANGQLYVAGFGSRNIIVIVIDGATTRITRNITVLEPSAIVWDNVSGYLYGTYPGYGNLTVIDGSNDSVIGTMTVGFYPVGIIGSPSNVYVTNYGSGTI